MIALEHVQVNFPNRVLLEDASLRVMPGDRFALIGDNGSGKSTLLKIAAGELKPTAGGVERQRGVVVGYLPQSGLAHRGRVLWEEAISALPEWLEAVEKRRRLLDKVASLSPELIPATRQPISYSFFASSGFIFLNGPPNQSFQHNLIYTPFLVFLFSIDRFY